MARLDVTALSSRSFSYDKHTRTLVTEASSLLGSPRRGQFQRIYDDACDVGLAVRSERTGVVLVFALHHEQRNENEIVWWDLTPIDRSAPDVTVRIYND